MNTRPFTCTRTTQKPSGGVSIFVVASALACLLLLAPWMQAGLVSAQAPPQLFAPTITTDRPEYEPGDTVVYSGTGFRHGEMVDVLAVGVTNGTELAGQSVADRSGDISGVLVLPLIYEATYSVVAAGLTSGRTANASFTDRVSLKIQTPSSPVRLNPGQVQLYVAVAQTSGGMGVQGLTLRWVPTGGTVNPLTSTTDTNGEASTLYIAGTILGRYEVYAEAVTDPMINAKQFLDIAAGKITPTITWSNPADIVYGTTLSNTQLNATASLPGTFVYTPPSGTVLGAGTGQTLHVDFTPSDTTNYNSAASDVTINVLKGTPNITWANPPDIVYGTALSGTQLNASASMPGAFIYTPAAGTVLSAGTGQTLSADFTTADSANYNSASASVTINVQTASGLVGLSGLSQTYDGTPKAVLVTTTPPGLSVAITYGGSGTAPTNAGSYAVIASITDPNYVGTASGTLNIAKATPSITWADPADIVYGAALSGSQLNASAPVPGSFSYAPPAGTVLAVGNGQTLHADFYPTDTVNYNNVSANVMIDVLGGTATISLGNLSQTYDGAPKAATATTSPAGLSVSITYNGSPAVPTNAGSYAVVATITDPNYPGTASGTLVIAKGTPLITWANPTAVTYGTALGSVQLNATASVPGSFVYTPGAGAVVSAGPSQPLHAAFTPTDAANYESAAEDVFLRVNPAFLVVRANDKTKVYGAPLPPLDASYSGFVLGQGPGVLSGSLACATTATATSISGTYPITCSGQTSANYAITYAAGTLTITGDPPSGVTPVPSSTPVSAGDRAVGGIAERPPAGEPVRGTHFWDWAVDFSSVLLVVLAAIALGGTGTRGLRRRK